MVGPKQLKANFCMEHLGHAVGLTTLLSFSIFMAMNDLHGLFVCVV